MAGVLERPGLREGEDDVALISCDYSSGVLGLMCNMKVILPQGVLTAKKNVRVPVLYLLHGLSDNESVWTRRTSIERYADQYNLAVVMPSTHRSWYTDAKQGYRYYTHVAEEVPQIARSLFPLSEKREENFIAGLSMGGYGAFKIALRNPDRFCAAASLSGAVDISQRMADVLGTETVAEFERIFGPLAKVKGGENDIFHLLGKLAGGVKGATRKEVCKKIPRLFQVCGTEDFLYSANIRFRDYVQKLGVNLDYTYAEGPGAHSWDYWDARIQEVLNWLPLRKL